MVRYSEPSYYSKSDGKPLALSRSRFDETPPSLRDSGEHYGLSFDRLDSSNVISGQEGNGYQRMQELGEPLARLHNMRQLEYVSDRHHLRPHESNVTGGTDRTSTIQQTTVSGTRERAVVGAAAGQLAICPSDIKSSVQYRAGIPRTSSRSVIRSYLTQGSNQKSSDACRRMGDMHSLVPQIDINGATLPSEPIRKLERSAKVVEIVDSPSITYGPDVKIIGQELLRTISNLKGDRKARQTRERGLARKRKIQTNERFIGEIVHIPSGGDVGTSIVHTHFDFATSNAYNHPAVIVQMKENVLTCLKLTTTPILKRFFEDLGPTVGSTFRALLYLPIDHRRGNGHELAEVYGVPLLQQDQHQRNLKNPSLINTERMFEIEIGNVRTYCTADEAEIHIWNMTKRRSFGFSVSLESLGALAKYLLETPCLRHFSRQEDLSQNMGEIKLTKEGVRCLYDYVRSPTAELVFQKAVWRRWLQDHDIPWSKVEKTRGRERSVLVDSGPRNQDHSTSIPGRTVFK